MSPSSSNNSPPLCKAKSRFNHSSQRQNHLRNLHLRPRQRILIEFPQLDPPARGLRLNFPFTRNRRGEDIKNISPMRQRMPHLPNLSKPSNRQTHPPPNNCRHSFPLRTLNCRKLPQGSPSPLIRPALNQPPIPPRNTNRPPSKQGGRPARARLRYFLL